MALIVGVADPATGVFTDLPTTVLPDGTVTVSLDHFGASQPSVDEVSGIDPAPDGSSPTDTTADGG
jgi:hypothetical protein